MTDVPCAGGTSNGRKMKDKYLNVDERFKYLCAFPVYSLSGYNVSPVITVSHNRLCVSIPIPPEWQIINFWIYPNV